MQAFIAALTSQRDAAYLFVRLMTGIILTFHGYQKVFVIGLSGVAEFFSKIQVPLPQLTGPFTGLLELGGGVLLILGLFTRLLGFLFTCEFIVATYFAWVRIGKGYSGTELEFMLLFASFLLATHGAGKYSLDFQMKREA